MVGKTGRSDRGQKFTFKKLSLIKINGVIIALELSKNIYCTHKSVVRAGRNEAGAELSRTRQEEQLGPLHTTVACGIVFPFALSTFITL